MKALIKQRPASQAEVFYEDSWLPWMDQQTGAPLNSEPYGYGLCEDAQSDNPDDYTLTKHTSVDEYGDEIITLTAKLKKGWKLNNTEEQ